MLIDVADMDVIYLSYDEPYKEEFWADIQNNLPWSKRVDGVKGSDNAHKAAAEESHTDWFVLIDGDHKPDYKFFNESLIEPNAPSSFRWKAYNIVNGLSYGNGGISIWHKDYVKNMKTHENSDGSPETAIEFCFDKNYYAMWNIYGTTHPNQSEYNAWRAGFREGVKMCLNQGVRPSPSEFEYMVHNKNMDNLKIWINIGKDEQYGEYCVNGALYGVYLLMNSDWDYTEVHDFEKLKTIYDSYLHVNLDDVKNTLISRFDLPINNYDASQSKFFKYYYKKIHQNRSFMTKEIDVIQEKEGWK